MIPAVHSRFKISGKSILGMSNTLDAHHPIFEHSDPTIWVSSTRGTPESNGFIIMIPTKIV